MSLEELIKKFSSTEFYEIGPKKSMGVALIFNQDNFELHSNLSDRKGSDKDVVALTKVLKLFNFEVRAFDNFETKEIKKVLKEAAAESHENRNCMLVTIMSHGDSEGIIWTYDDHILAEDLYKPFIDPRNCKTLEGKPKIFLIQACRGMIKDFGAVIEEEVKPEKPEILASRTNNFEASPKATKKFITLNLDDVLIYFSTSEGHPSFKSEDGSWFIQSICENLQRVHDSECKTDLMNILLRVNRDVAFSRQARTSGNFSEFNACKQMPVIFSMLTKTFLIGEDKKSGDDDEV